MSSFSKFPSNSRLVPIRAFAVWAAFGNLKDSRNPFKRLVVNQATVADPFMYNNLRGSHSVSAET